MRLELGKAGIDLIDVAGFQSSRILGRYVAIGVEAASLRHRRFRQLSVTELSTVVHSELDCSHGLT